ncbi:phosphoribosylanthranilate isomerase, partial [Streptococcus ferus]|uniref:phosphoribosylanthranilate isomerase n=1 Tax=Streptococcus ferus TaxID=1345 RepID=UPI0035A026FA
VESVAYDNTRADNLATMRAFFDQYFEKYVSPNAKISLLLKEGQDLVFKSHIIKPLSLDLHTMYNDDFVTTHHRIKRELSTSNKGLVLLHGVAGSGKTFDWQALDKSHISQDFFIAGGLTADNVLAAIEAFSPYAVDVSSGVETDGQKDVAKITTFIERVKA